MSFFKWFGRRVSTLDSPPSHNSGLGQADTVPLDHSKHVQTQTLQTTDAGARRSDRLERRELLYGVVRECMTGAGMLSSTYKFKVLSLDSSGRQYLIMMDLPQAALSDPTRFAEMEGLIARSAKERFNILVTAVYWRVNELVTSWQKPVTRAPLAPAIPSNAAPANPVAAKATPATELPLDEEMLAFKRAVSSAARGSPAVRGGEFVRSGRRNPEPIPDFSDTEPFEAPSALGPSQFGGLS
jgi:hypothetical protein